MIIKTVDVRELKLTIPKPFAISSHTFATYHALFIKLTSSTGAVGWGEAAPFAPISGDSIATAIAEIAQFKRSARKEFETVQQFSEQQLTNILSPSLQAALDMACCDLVAASQKIPVRRLFGSSNHSCLNAITVFLKEDSAATVAETKRLLALYPELKVLKIKLSGVDDIDRVRAVKSVCASDISFALDANESYSGEEVALASLEQIGKVLKKVLLIEEPVPRRSYAKLRFIRERMETPIYADESCLTMHDLETLITEQCVGGINIKLQKVGGIHVARKLAAKAASAGLKVMFGQMFESPLATAATIHTAATIDNVVLTDLDIDMELPLFCRAATKFTEGRRIPLDEPGFGFAIDDSAINELEEAGLLEIRSH